MRRWLIRHLPTPLVKIFAGPYIAGDSIQCAIDTAAGLKEDFGGLSTLDILGEECREPGEADEFAALYIETLEAVAKDQRLLGQFQPTLSFKPSALTRVRRHENGDLDFTHTNLDACSERIRQVTTRARDLQVDVTLDMEDRHWTEFTVATCERLVSCGFSNFGTVLQTRLHRTVDDIERIPAGGRIRLVIGIYDEPADVAIGDRSEMKARLLSYGQRLLERGVKVELATHDEAIVARFRDEVVQGGGHDPSQVEFQFLLGVPRRTLQKSLIADGYRVRIYVPFATEWHDALAYARRRLHENPTIMTYGVKNMLRLRQR